MDKRDSLEEFQSEYDGYVGDVAAVGGDGQVPTTSLENSVEPRPLSVVEPMTRPGHDTDPTSTVSRSEDPTLRRQPEDPTHPNLPDGHGTDVFVGLGTDDPTCPQQRTEDLGVTDAPRSLPYDFEVLPPTTLYYDDTNHPGSSHGYVGVNDDSRGPGDLRFLDDESLNLPPGRADASSSSSSFDSRASSVESDDEDLLDEVQQTKNAKKAEVKVRPEPPGPSPSDEIVFGRSVGSQRRSC
ncbi:hypothetical protein AALP_AA8G314300 [Arabis alpina]|uniref:Uncharacterized protein n=1 Tax=Arabis alpina TaxID=50452 RepID=A0A087GAP5_ARAAL|nr:hypothetical protein AALP_AA8G314300 [Arabis alpina]